MCGMGWEKMDGLGHKARRFLQKNQHALKKFPFETKQPL